jgi:hypothetical protein
VKIANDAAFVVNIVKSVDGPPFRGEFGFMIPLCIVSELVGWVAGFLEAMVRNK